MAFDRDDFRGFVSHTLSTLRLHSPAAVNLLLGTCAQESEFGHYRKQIRGPALGVMQIEPETFVWMRRLYGRRFGFEERIFRDLADDDRLSVIVARMRYLVVQEPLPQADDVAGLARYWKKYYNTAAGKGTEAEFIANYERFVA